MTKTQKFLKQIPDSSGCIPMPKAQVLRRVRLRGAEYTTRIEAWMAAHEQKRVRLLQARKEAEAKAAAAAKAAQKASKL